MKLCIIAPTSGLQQFATQSEGVHLALVHLVQKDSDYAHFYRQRSLLGDLIILDNGAFEFGRPCSTKLLLDAADYIKAHVIVAPDWPGEKWQKTMVSTEGFCNALEKAKAPYKVMGCPQSVKGDWRGWLKGVTGMARFPKISHIGVSILATPNAFGANVGTFKDIELCRMMANSVLKNAIREKYVKLRGKKLHYLGAGHRLDMLQYYDLADSLDTSSPVWHGWQGIRYEFGFLPHGKSQKPVDFAANLPAPDAVETINFNIAELKKWARKAEGRGTV